MKSSNLRPARLAWLGATLILSGQPAGAATVNGPRPSSPVEAMQKVVIPSRDEVLTIDWVDAKAARIAIGGVTYPLSGAPPRIVLAAGEEVTTIGYLKAGMRARIETARDRDGATRLIAIRVEP